MNPTLARWLGACVIGLPLLLVGQTSFAHEKVTHYLNPYPHPHPSLWVTPKMPSKYYREHSHTFHKPHLGKYRLDFCYKGVHFCGRAAANAYCQQQGYRYASRFWIDRNVGLTKNIGNHEVFRHASRDSFKRIRCRM